MSALRAFTMPKWGIEMVEGIVSDWQVGEGDAFSKGDVLVGIETDKIVNEVEAEYDAVCLRRLAEEGDTLSVGELLAVFGEADASADEVDAFIQDFVPAGGARETTDSVAQPESEAAAAVAPETVTPGASAPVTVPDGVRISAAGLAAAGELGVEMTTVAGNGRNGRIQRQDVQRAALPPFRPAGQPVSNAVDLAAGGARATDVARRLAKREGVDLGTVTGSGRNGRIRSRDLPRTESTPNQDAAAPATASTTAAAPATTSVATATGTVPFSNMRKQIARRLTASYQNIPHYNVQMDVFVDALVSAREAYNAAAPRRSSINDWLVRAVALALVKHPDININVGDEAITQFDDANVAIAIAIDGGLITPVLKRAQVLSVNEISERAADLAVRAKNGELTGDDMSDGSFTISNLGMFGVSRFTAIINPPQGAILAVGAARPVPTERDGRMVFGQQLTLTLGCDHRAIDGAMAGRFLATVRDLIEQPRLLLGE